MPCLVRDSLVDQSMLFTHLYLTHGEKQKPGLYLQKAENILVLNLQLFCLPANPKKSLPTGKMNC